MNGLLLLDKPAGMTSFAAAAKVRRCVGEKKAGHTGTLDPMATGVLPILLGQGTRFASYLPDHTKAYAASFRLGITTDTLDSTGTVLEQKPVTADAADVEAALESFRGEIRQVPPMYSALKKDGKKLYELAREGITIEREARTVTVASLALTDTSNAGAGEYTLFVECSAGTYIRSLIDDLGQALGCGAVMTALRRTKANGFCIESCRTLEKILSDGPQILPLSDVLSAYPSVTVSAAQAVRFANGGALSAERCDMGAMLPIWNNAPYYRLHSPAGKFLGLARLEGGELCPEKVVAVT
ncbi:MAG: tRNA pseudouridine(55) synthase TruB [Oscillospiraceae bacterium]|jgi:tRNA pseudouridine55 synthase|nr:tRNA pseudouridine(55) synthase TruB [Oscillospiraceae bacterium]